MSRNLTRDEAAARLEDCRWMAETGECLDGAARRLDVSRKALEKWLAANDRACLAALIARQPRDHNRFADLSDRRMPVGQLTGRSAARARTRARARAREQEAA